jgi:two-component system phosphate regulon sensor histidine kinase PhoR
MSSGLMQGTTSTAQGRGFRRIGILLVWLVTVPTALLLVVGSLMLIFSETNLNILFGIFVLSLVAFSVTGVVLSLVYLRREANLSKLQMDFVSKVSHELKTPLTSIRMFVDMLQMKRVSSPAELEQCIAVLQKETTRLNERIDRLLDWGRMEAGRRVYDLHVESVDTIVAEAAAVFDASTVGRGVALELAVASGLPLVMADRAAMEDALVNLLTNAYKYTGDTKQIGIGARADEKFVYLWVRDNGIGIPRGEQRRVFEKFYRVDERLSRAIEGSGLGLAIVRHIVLAHHGRIDIDSEPGKGSTFTIALPHASARDVAAAKMPLAAPETAQ